MRILNLTLTFLSFFLYFYFYFTWLQRRGDVGDSYLFELLVIWLKVTLSCPQQLKQLPSPSFPWGFCGDIRWPKSGAPAPRGGFKELGQEPDSLVRAYGSAWVKKWYLLVWVGGTVAGTVLSKSTSGTSLLLLIMPLKLPLGMIIEGRKVHWYIIGIVATRSCCDWTF